MYGSWFWFTFVGFPDPPRAGDNIGKMRVRFGFKRIRRDICRLGRGARTGAHLGERPDVGALALCRFREKYWLMAFTFN